MCSSCAPTVHSFFFHDNLRNGVRSYERIFAYPSDALLGNPGLLVQPPERVIENGKA